jgi:hypothetical protein
MSLRSRLEQSSLLTFDSNGAPHVDWGSLREYITNLIRAKSYSIFTILEFVNDELGCRIADEVATQPGDSKIGIQKHVVDLLHDHHVRYGTSSRTRCLYTDFPE